MADEDAWQESALSVESGLTDKFVPYLTINNTDGPVVMMDPAEAFQIGTHLLLQSRAILDEVNLFQIFSEMEIPLDNALEIVNRLRRDRGTN